jgi:hypothetical protein
MTRSEDALLRMAADVTGVPPTSVSEIARAMGACHASPRRFSTLNNDGSPLQLCETLTWRGSTTRLIADPHSAISDVRQRLASTCTTLRAVAEQAGAGDLADVLLATVRLNLPLPDELATCAAMNGGLAWIGAGLRDPGVALYVNAGWGRESDRWARVERWLGKTLPVTRSAAQIVPSLATTSEVVSVGVEGVSPGCARVKVYVRLKRVVSLDRLGVAGFEDAGLARCLLHLVGERRLPRAGLTLCVGFSCADGAHADVKIDVCGHCVGRPSGEWVETVGTLASLLGAEQSSFVTMPNLEDAEVALVGVGVDRSGRRKLNIYMKARGRGRCATC